MILGQDQKNGNIKNLLVDILQDSTLILRIRNCSISLSVTLKSYKIGRVQVSRFLYMYFFWFLC